MEIKKVVVKLNIHDDKDRRKAMKAVASLTGINTVEVDTKEGKMTVIGEVDPVLVVSKLKKQWNAQIMTVGPPKEEKKDDKKDDKKKDDNKKDDEKKDDEKIAELIKAYKAYHPPVYCYCYCRTIDECPSNSCVIC